jgi:hypothetical protein
MPAVVRQQKAGIMTKQMREALEAVGIKPSPQFKEDSALLAEREERKARAARQAAAATRLEQARVGLAAVAKKGN